KGARQKDGNARRINSCVVDILANFYKRPAKDPAIYALSLHDALPIYCRALKSFRQSFLCPKNPRLSRPQGARPAVAYSPILQNRSEEHTSELQSPCNLVCRLLLEKIRLLRMLRWSRSKTPDKPAQGEE